MRKRLLLTALAVITLLVGCRGTPSPAPTPQASPSPDSSIEEVSSDPGRLEVKVEGATAFTYQQTVPIQIYLGGLDPRVPANLRLLSVGLLQHVDLEDGRKMRLAFDLLGYEQDGKFTIAKDEQPQGGTPASNIRSNVFIELVPPDLDFTKMVRFEILLDDCALEISRRGREGQLVCPKVQQPQEGVVSLVMEWNVPPTGSRAAY